MTGLFPAKNTLILSDIHLNVAPDGRENMEHFTAFLRGVDPARFQRMILLGDLFDFWFEYRHVIFSDYFHVLRAFVDLRDHGMAFHFVCGNHDFWAGRFLRDYLGFEIHCEPVTLDFGGQRVLFAHGDGINPEDRAYRIYKRIARAPLVIGLFRLLHPDWAMALAQRVSRGSRHMFGAEDLSKGPEVEALLRFARGVLERDEADVVMCGHSHHPMLEHISTPHGVRLYINTGDWMNHQSYVVWDGEAFRLERHGGSR